MEKNDKIVDVEPAVKQLGDKPSVTLHLDRDPNDPRVPKRTVLAAFKKGEAVRNIFDSEIIINEP